MAKKGYVYDLFFMRPWAINEGVLRAMTEIVERHISGEKLSEEEVQAAIAKPGKKPDTDYQVVGDVAVIPIYGVIAKRANMVGGISRPRGTSVEAIERDLDAALADESVNTVLLDIDSPGGSVDGIAPLADKIYEARSQKKVVAFANGMMASAAYWIGAAAEEVYAEKSAAVGSIGVYSVINDWTVANHNMGIKTEVIKAGRHKAAGHPDKVFSEEDRAVIQEEVNEYYGLFMEAVGRNRGMTAEDVEKVATGKLFIGKKAVSAGLVDAIKNFGSVVRGLATVDHTVSKRAAAVTADSTTNKKEVGQMEETIKNLTVDELKKSRADLYDAIFAEGKAAGVAEGKTEGIKEGAANEKARILGIQQQAQTLQIPEEAAAFVESGTTIEEASSKLKDKKLELLSASAPATQGAGDDPEDEYAEKKTKTQQLSVEEQCKKEWETNPNVRDEFVSLEAYTGYTKGVASGMIKPSRN